MRALATSPRDVLSPARLKGRIDARLGELLPGPVDHHDLVSTAMREATLGAGKRTRPLLMLIAGDSLGAGLTALVDAGCAVEMVHAASLVLDDMPCMDDADLRRGRATIHRRFGEDVAALAAIGLLSQAFATTAAIAGVSPAVRNQLVRVLACAIGPRGLVRGQCLDLRNAGAARVDAITDTNALKTGALFAAALDMTALLAQADPRTRSGLCTIALELGQAFQLQDDLSDCDASTSTGKNAGQDIGKATLLAALGADEVRRRLDLHLQTVRREIALLYGDGSPLAAFCTRLFEVQ